MFFRYNTLMSKKPIIPRPNRESYLKHRREFRRQILLPIVLIVLAALALAALVGVATFRDGGDVGRWAAISTIWMSIPALGLLLVVMMVLITLIYGLGRLIKVTPKYTGLVQEYALYVSARVVQINKQITTPVIRIKAWLSLFSREEEK